MTTTAGRRGDDDGVRGRPSEYCETTYDYKEDRGELCEVRVKVSGEVEYYDKEEAPTARSRRRHP